MQLRFRSLLAALMLLVTLPAIASNWYIRKDGGTRYSANVTTGQCNGRADAPYPGTGVNQPCAFNDYRFLWDDQTYNNDAWVIAGGDTVIVRDGPWRVGWDAATGIGAGGIFCKGGGTSGCGNPPIPAGTPSQHTRILGGGFAGCSTNGAVDKSRLTQIFGGFGLGTPLNLANTQYVDVQCLEVTRHSQCIFYGTPQYPAPCRRDSPIDDFDSDGVTTNIGTHDILLQDMWIHGHNGRGIKGTIGSGPFTCLRCEITYNGGAGWDFDDGRGTPFGPGAVWNFNYSTIAWNGCNQEYPIVSTYPAISCYGQSNAGYGDGVGTQSGSGFDVYIDHSSFHHNTQDGLDLGHVDTGSHTLNITNSTAYTNNGGTFKWGGNFTSVIFTNNLVQGDCLRMSQPISGAPSTYNANLNDFCRAQDGLSFNFRNGGTALVAGNTIINYAPTTIDIGCWDANGCPLSALTFKDNIVYGIDNPNTYNMGGKPGGPGFIYFQPQSGTSIPGYVTVGNVVRSNNLLYGLRDTTCVTTELCNVDPQFVSKVVLHGNSIDGLDVHLKRDSPAMSTGTTVAGLGNDIDGTARGNPPNIGAYGLAGVVPTYPVTPVTPVVPDVPVVPDPPAAPTPTKPAKPADTPQPNPTTPTVNPVVPAVPANTTAVWFKVADEGSYVTLPAGVTYRFGKNSQWTSSATTTSTTRIYAYYTALGDPAPGIVKEFDVQVVAAPLTVSTVDARGAASSVLVPGLTTTPAPVVTTPVITPTTPVMVNPPAATASWYKVANEGSYVTVPAGTTFRFGVGSRWTAPATTTTSTRIYAYYTVLGDPAPGIVKQLDIQQGSRAISLTVTTSAGNTQPLVVPALGSPTTAGKQP